jgi:hypothetical protein
MTISSRRSDSSAGVVRQILLLTGCLIVLPLAFYPKQLGFPPFDLNPAAGLLEWVFYVGVFTVASSQLAFSTRIVAAGFTVVYRLLIGALVGTLVSMVHGRPWGPTTAELMWSYPLSLIPQILIAPLVLRPLWERLLGSSTYPDKLRRLRRHSAQTVKPAAGAVASRRGVGFAPSAGSTSAARPAGQRALAAAMRSSEPSLDDAVSYVGEYSGVRMCWIVDDEGLPLAVWQRQQYTGDADFWAPVSIEMVDFHRRRLSAVEPCLPARVEVRTDQGRLIIESVSDLWLGVLTDAESDDLIGVRLNRACEMIARHFHEQSREVHYV